MNTGTSIPVRDNHGYTYEARALAQGDTYGNGATWTDEKPGITIDGNAPGTWYAETLADFTGGYLALDYGQNWHLDEDSTLRIARLAREATRDLAR